MGRDLDKIAGKREPWVDLMSEENADTMEKSAASRVFHRKGDMHSVNVIRAIRIFAAALGSLLTVAIFRLLARRLASA